MRRLLPVWATLLAAAPAPAADPPPYKAGVAAVDITPAHPIRLNGFGGRRAESDGVYQPIHAKALALDDGANGPAVLMAVDVLGITAEHYAELAKRLQKKAGLKPERLAVTATHTHTGPMVAGANPTLFGVPIPPEHQKNIDKYTPVFLDKLEAAALAALKGLKPAKLEWAVGTAKFAINRRTQGGPTDHDLPVLFVKDEAGKVRAVYLNYACHCVTLSHNKVGGDWAGFAARAVEDQFPGSVALVGIGCGADQNPNARAAETQMDIPAGQGREIAAEVRRLSQNALTAVSGPITAKVTTLDLPLADLPDRAGWQEKAKRDDAVGHHARVTLAKLDRGEKLPTKIVYPIQTWAFGDRLAMAFLPGEVVVDYALRLKKELDGRRLWTTAYANNAPGYVPSERVLKEGGYEGGGAMIYYDIPAAFKPGLEQPIVDAVKALLGKTFAPKHDGDKTGGTRPLSPHQSLARIQVGPGLKAELVAAEPLVADPVAIAFGPDGKLWVAEMADYPNGRTDKFDPGGRVVFLEDRDGDGFMDHSFVFLDNLPFPTGVLPWRKGVLICAAPDILYAEDTDGDGKADKVEKLYTGFGTDNYQGRVNGLEYGLDGWVYGSCGLFGGNIVCHKSGKTVALGDRDFRIKPDTGEMEAATGRTQQGRVRNDAGDWFGCDSGTPAFHYPLDDHHLRRNPHVAYPNPVVRVAVEPTTLFPAKADVQRFALSGPPGNVTAACGLGIYRDDLLGKNFAGDAFVCEPVNLLVHRRKLVPRGTSFAGVRADDEKDREFLASSDPWFRPVQVVTGPDGGLWVADMYRFLIEHPRWVPPADLAKIDIRAGAGLGRLYRVRAENTPLRPWPRLDRLDTAGLVAALDSPNGWQRDMAMMMLVWKNDPAAREPLLKLLKDSPRPLARLHALCALAGTRAWTPDGVVAALSDPDPVVQRHAVRQAAGGLTASRTRQLAVHPDPQVRRAVAAAVGASADPEDGQALAWVALEAGDDPYLTATALSSLTGKNLPAFAAAVFEQAGKDGPPATLVRGLLASAAGIDNGASLPDLLKVVAKPDGDTYRPWQLAAGAGALDALARRGKLPADIRDALRPVVAHARTVCEKDDAAEAELLAAVPLLGRDGGGDVPRLAVLLAPARPASVQAAAVAGLVRVSDKSVPPALVGAWAEASPALRNLLLDALLSRPAWTADLLAAVKAGTIPAGQIDAGRRQRLLDAGGDRAKTLLAAGTNADRQKVIDQYRPALAMTGDRARGKAVFARVCSACHALDGAGHAVGPDLAALPNKSPQYLIAEILDPSRNLDSRYVEYKAATKDGRVVSGLLAAETATAITLRGQQAKDETVLRADLESLRGTAKSLMPEGLEKDLPPQDLADLVAYLTTSDAPHKRLDGNEPAEVAAVDNRLTLPAAKAFVYGDAIVFEGEFGNLGYWHGEKDHAAWRVRLDKPTAFDVYLDHACANDSAGNALALDGADPPLRATVAGTGGWDRYALRKLGTVKVPAGVSRLTVRPDGPPRGAVLDLRTVYLVPVGAEPKAAADDKKPRTPAELAAVILDDKAPQAAREAAAREAIPQAGAVVRALVADLGNDPKEEYRRIPWVWRVAVGAGKANDAAVLRGLLDASLPEPNGKLRDWQEVVLGGGIVNGLTQAGVWPAARMAELLKDDPARLARWRRAVELSHAMADDDKVPHGTRYDALRMAALDDWEKARPRLAKYLAKDAHPELQQGAVSGLGDIDRPEAATALVKALPDLTPENRTLAVGGLVRTSARAGMLIGAIEAGTGKLDWVNSEQRATLLTDQDPAVRARAAKLFGK
ncbi:MAG: c-type cytochrome [Gemmataceae bacterium]|nr:c-type cytochrome [Gemmataceae bacterium]